MAAAFPALVPACLQAHAVPSTEIVASFKKDRSYTLTINLDPRSFLAPDPTTLPPVPGSWYRDQSKEQIAATHAKARDYLAQVVSLIFSTTKAEQPAADLVAIDGNDNTPFKAETEEIHLLATLRGTLPAAASDFQIAYAKTATTSLILLIEHEGETERRPQVIFPGETSRAIKLAAEALPLPPPALPKSNDFLLMSILSITVILLIIGWRLLIRYRHYHRSHRKPRSDDSL
jgi:hypothetical protein